MPAVAAYSHEGSPFGGIPRNWKLPKLALTFTHASRIVPPSGGSLEIGNGRIVVHCWIRRLGVPPSGGSLEIGNYPALHELENQCKFPLRGDP